MAPAQRRSKFRYSASARSSVDAREVEKFAALAGEWWNPDGKFAPLHRLNPVRLAFIRNVALRHFDRDAKALAPFSGLTLLDVGCGGGLVTEAVARLGFDVLGIDAADENVAIAATHAREMATPPRYRSTAAEELVPEQTSFDVVLALEILEHVVDRAEFLATLAQLIKPGGLIVLATLNRTLKSLALAIFGAEYILRWLPAGTHDWNKFVSPETLASELRELELTVDETRGITFDPLGWTWHLSADTGVNYMIAAKR
ncbi:MAG TPA: bifunctional 2-polyprenyl-6-hydroxyphenol methylase/3-demethylubiquinol 3-O-methyltransferase UbiG [Rhizomicrobium sp.]|jgi:2-polyprenyl-6-hydroxyphenyl methylase/3-demethylubiquinone-9 3-methyltransferase|nr:bifunctional 2-polyprenyl-6-hydroxyphenol methylase/3-demethylubiquinol 3-O-methyltransferase UbiG [Rhizomicrobium sp.]